MNKIENDEQSSRKEDSKSARDVLWWMKKGKNTIYVQFVNNMRIT